MDSSLTIDRLYKKYHTRDVCFIVEDIEKGRSIRVTANKCILAANSNKFDEDLFSAEPGSEIKISEPHISSDGFKAFIDMFYGKKTN